MAVRSSPILFLVLLAWTHAPAAEAGDCLCERYGAGAHVARDPCHPSTRYVLPRHGRFGHAYQRPGCAVRGYGTPWSVLRRGLVGRGSPEYRKWYVGHYFLHRYPFAVADAEDALVDRLLAVGQDPETQAPLSPALRLRRGTARFFAADYAGAGADFDAVLAATPADARARLGHLFTAFCRNDWKTAAADLDALATRGELKADDRVSVEGSFSDPKVFDAVTEGLVGHASYSIGNGNAHLVAGWALAARGKEAPARAQLRLARRYLRSSPALDVLEKNLGIAREPAKSEPAPATGDPVRAPRAPAQRIVAVAKPKRS